MSGAEGPDLESLTQLAALILRQEEGIADGSLADVGGYLYPALEAGTVPSFGEVLAGLRVEHARDGFWDDSGILGG